MPPLTSGAVAAALSILALQTPNSQVGDYLANNVGKAFVTYLASKEGDRYITSGVAAPTCEDVEECGCEWPKGEIAGISFCTWFLGCLCGRCAPRGPRDRAERRRNARRQLVAQSAPAR